MIVTTLSFMTIVASFALAIVYFDSLPERIPIHFGLNGQPDGWAGKAMIFVLPSMGLFSFILLCLAGKFPQFSKKPWLTEEQNQRRFEASRRILPWLNLQIGAMFAYIEWETIQTANGVANGINPTVMIGFVASVIVFSIYLTIKAWRTK